jgi:hypothetical protein
MHDVITLLILLITLTAEQDKALKASLFTVSNATLFTHFSYCDLMRDTTGRIASL